MAYCDRNLHFGDSSSLSDNWRRRDFYSNRAFHCHYRGRSAEVSSSIDGADRWFSSSRLGRTVDFWDDVHSHRDIFHEFSGIMTPVLE